jgi:hypothetical protein
MNNRYSKGAHVSEARFREVIRFSAADLPSPMAAESTGLNYRTVHGINSFMWERLVEMTLLEMQPFAGDIEVDAVTDPLAPAGHAEYEASEDVVQGVRSLSWDSIKQGDRVFVNVAQNCSKQEPCQWHRIVLELR